MGLPVVTVATGGLPIVESTSGLGTPVTESTIGRGVAVTKVVGKPGLPVIFETIGAGPPPVLATFDGAASGVTLSNGNLTAGYASGANSGARSAAVKSSGKYYFEFLIGTMNTSPSNGSKAGILLSTGTYLDMNSVINAVAVILWNGAVWTNSSISGKSLGACNITGMVIGCAIDLDNRKAWFRLNGGNWNGEIASLQNPATSVGGINIQSGSLSPAIFLNWAVGDTVSGNFGQSAFTTAAPSGFSNWA